MRLRFHPFVHFLTLFDLYSCVVRGLAKPVQGLVVMEPEPFPPVVAKNGNSIHLRGRYMIMDYGFWCLCYGTAYFQTELSRTVSSFSFSFFPSLLFMLVSFKPFF